MQAHKTMLQRAEKRENPALGKLSVGDMIALEAKYHKCLLGLYNCARKIKADASQDEPQVSGIAFAELVMYSASSLVCHFCYTFYSNYGRFVWFMTPYSADFPEIYYTVHLTLHV